MNSTEPIEVFYKNRSAASVLGEFLSPYLLEDTIILCIGTDKCIGDCLGPLVGTFLKRNSFPLPVYGTLDDPVHAVNLYEKVIAIKRRHPHSSIISLDACLSEEDRIGNIEIRQGPIYPGKGIGKKLPAIGDLSIIGIVDSVDKDTHITLHTIRLSFIMTMAEVITQGLLMATKKQ